MFPRSSEQLPLYETVSTKRNPRPNRFEADAAVADSLIIECQPSFGNYKTPIAIFNRLWLFSFLLIELGVGISFGMIFLVAELIRLTVTGPRQTLCAFAILPRLCVPVSRC